jgi:hypothetical protein
MHRFEATAYCIKLVAFVINAAHAVTLVALMFCKTLEEVGCISLKYRTLVFMRCLLTLGNLMNWYLSSEMAGTWNCVSFDIESVNEF